jgi:NADPH:quinone reductase-like Zn-dependent oxidoreductase
MAIVQDESGSPDDALELEDIDKPVLRDGEALVRVHTAVFSIGHWHIMTGLPHIMCLAFELLKPKNCAPG